MRNVCIFCGEGRLTKEHVWPDWLRNYIRRSGVRTRHRSGDFIIQNERINSSNVGFGKQNRTGNVTSRKLRVVCGDCNNGWMSRLQKAAKPLLVQLIEKKWCINTERDHEIISNWITMFTMVAEFLNPSRVAVSNLERRGIS